MAGIAMLMVSTSLAIWLCGFRQVFALPKFSGSQLALRMVPAYARLSVYKRALLIIPLATVVLVGALNATVVFFSAPHNWDSLSYHLARMGYYAQHQNLSYFQANYWAQVSHPTVAPVLLLWTYLVTGRHENLLQLVQFASYWVGVVGVYAIARQLGYRRAASLMAAAVSAQLIEWLMQATTPQNDMMLTAFVGASVYYLLAFRITPRSRYLGLSAVSIALSIGIKASAFVPLLSVALVGLFALYQARSTWTARARDLGAFGFSLAVTVGLMLANAGYLDNMRQYGHPLGPRFVVRAISFEEYRLADVLRIGTKNMARFGLEFLSLDGLPPFGPVLAAQSVLRVGPIWAISATGIDLEAPFGARVPFQYDKLPAAHEDISYWGVLGFGLIWIVVILTIMGRIRASGLRPMAWAALLFVVGEAFAGPYDPWRGRYFMTAAIFAVPLVAAVFNTRRRWVQVYVCVVALLGCTSAILGVVLREDTSLITVQAGDFKRTSIFTLDRLQQFTQARSDVLAPLRQYEEHVPADATVAVFLPDDSFEYPLFGVGMSRQLFPIHSFLNGLQPIPPEADYLLYAGEFACATEGDLALGNGWFLRQLTNANRACP